MSTDDILLGLGLVLVLAVAGQLLAEHVYRVAPDPEQPDLLPPPREIGILGGPALTFAELDRRFAAGAQITNRTDASPADNGTELALFAVTPRGRLSVAADGHPPNVRPGDSVIALASRRRDSVPS